jgi:hypothetical protein
MRKFTPLILVVLVAIVIIARYCDGLAPRSEQAEIKPPQIKAVHYFSSSWPKSFWGDFEYSQVDDDFAQIKADGFNTVIFVIPWMGFEIGFEDGISEPSLLYERLEWLLKKTEQAGLDYGLRVSFPHNFDPEIGTDNARLCADIFTDKPLRENWVQYLARISERIDLHRDSFKFAFFSWEDFFCPYDSFPNMNEDQRMDLAQRSGYQAWLTEHYPMQLVELLYLQSFYSMESVPVPERNSPAFWFFLRFVDQFLIDQLITPGREVLPELAMEVRVDKDPIYNGSKTFWVEHDLALSDEQMRGSYWGAYYGAHNQGELLTAEEALDHFEFMLNDVSDDGKNTNHVVEQFNFADNTPGFVGHAQIDTPELPAFLEGAAGLLKQKSRGYGLWAYRDYVDSAIYNGSFELGTRGWASQGEVEVITNDDGDKALIMQAGAVISQTFSPYARFAGLGPSEQITFCANFKVLTESAQITFSQSGTPLETLDIEETGQHCVVFDAQIMKQSEIEFSISSDAEIQMDDLRLYSFVQMLNVYDENGKPGPLRDLIVRMNTDWLAD